MSASRCYRKWFYTGDPRHSLDGGVRTGGVFRSRLDLPFFVFFPPFWDFPVFFVSFPPFLRILSIRHFPLSCPSQAPTRNIPERVRLLHAPSFPPAIHHGQVLVSHDFRLIDQVAKEIWVCLQLSSVSRMGRCILQSLDSERRKGVVLIKGGCQKFHLVVSVVLCWLHQKTGICSIKKGGFQNIFLWFPLVLWFAV